MTAQYTFVMKDLRKLVPPKREILKGIWLSFYHGAKIGVLGNNGAGKSTLLRIMAGVDKEFVGEAFPAPGLKVDLWAAEPLLANPVAFNFDEHGRAYVCETFRLHAGVEPHAGGSAQMWPELVDDLKRINWRLSHI